MQVTEFGDVDGEFYLAMEEVDGFDLGHVLQPCGSWVEQRGPPPRLFQRCRWKRGLAERSMPI